MAIQWYQVLIALNTMVIIPLVVMIWKQNQRQQEVQAQDIKDHKIENDTRVSVLESDTKEIKQNYLDRFATVNKNIAEMRDEVTNRLTSIETKLSIKAKPRLVRK